jgi:hypothetical protein
MFDKRTNSKMVNLTEYWLERYRPECLKNKTLTEFLTNINRVVPVASHWSNGVFKIPDSPVEFELLFVAFKSNELAVFLVFVTRVSENDDETELNIELYELYNLESEANQSEEDEHVNTEMVRKTILILTHRIKNRYLTFIII